jgi:hypothetical protein
MLLKQSFRAVIVKNMQICCLNDEQLRGAYGKRWRAISPGNVGSFFSSTEEGRRVASTFQAAAASCRILLSNPARLELDHRRVTLLHRRELRSVECCSA